MQFEINEQTVDRQLVDAGMKSDHEEQAIRQMFFHLFCAIRYYRDMTYAEKNKAGFLYRTKFKNTYSLTGFFKERKRKRDKKGSPLHPSYKEESGVKDKAQKIIYIAGREAFHQECLSYVDKYDEQRLADFYNYWSEVNEQTGKMRFKEQRYWNTERRLKRWMNTSYSVENTASALRLKRLTKKEPEQKAVAAKRDEDNARLEQEIEARKAGAVSYEEYLKMKEKNESNDKRGTGV